MTIEHASRASRACSGVLASKAPARRLYESVGFAADLETLDAPIVLMAPEV